MERSIKRFIWLYFILLVLEGALRKWIFPGLSEVLLVVRDPVVVAIYGLAFMQGVFPRRGAVLCLLVLAVLSFVFATIAGTPLAVVLYGIRINYFHVPLIFVMGAVMDRDDVHAFGRAILWATPFITFLMILQYLSGSGSRLNVGAGGELEGQLNGALGKSRPSGPFSFITGPVLWFSLATSFVFHGWVRPRLYSRVLLAVATLAVLVAVPVSISRNLLFSVLVVVMFGLVSLLRNPRRALAIVAPTMLVLMALPAVDQSELSDAFESRWNTSIGTGVQDSIVNRFFGDFLGGFELISSAPILGNGVGMGSNFGARYTRGSMGFSLAEFEWSKIILELGPLLGMAFIAYRCWLVAGLASVSAKRLLSGGDCLPWLLVGACCLPILSGQWAPPTVLGFAVFGGGLVYASLNDYGDASEELLEEDDLERDSGEVREPRSRRRVR